MNLHARLAAIAEMVPYGSRVADIGTDHAYLPVYLLEKKIISLAIASDVCRGPLNIARKTVQQRNSTDRIELRLGNGLDVLTPGEVDTIIVAGMGGATIIEILRSRPQIMESLQRLILQPMAASAALRRWLIMNQWIIIDEQLVLEDGRLYEIIAAKPGDSKIEEPILYDIGPVLWQQKHPLLKMHIDKLIDKLVHIIQEMRLSQTAVNTDKFQQYVAKHKKLEEMRACL